MSVKLTARTSSTYKTMRIRNPNRARNSPHRSGRRISRPNGALGWALAHSVSLDVAGNVIQRQARTTSYVLTILARNDFHTKCRGSAKPLNRSRRASRRRRRGSLLLTRKTSTFYPHLGMGVYTTSGSPFSLRRASGASSSRIAKYHSFPERERSAP